MAVAGVEWRILAWTPADIQDDVSRFCPAGSWSSPPWGRRAPCLQNRPPPCAGRPRVAASWQSTRRGLRPPRAAAGDVITQVGRCHRSTRPPAPAPPALAVPRQPARDSDLLARQLVDPGPAHARGGAPDLLRTEEAGTGIRSRIGRGARPGRRELGVDGDLPDLELGRAKEAAHGDYASPAGAQARTTAAPSPPRSQRKSRAQSSSPTAPGPRRPPVLRQLQAHRRVAAAPLLPRWRCAAKVSRERPRTR